MGSELYRRGGGLMTPGARGWVVLLCLVLAAFAVGFSTGGARERDGWQRQTAPEVVRAFKADKFAGWTR
jgi:hypothetical protein